MIEHCLTQQNFFYSSDGGYSNTCAIQICQICPTIGQYRQNCGANSHSDPGSCVACTNLPTGGQWTSHGWFNNSCEFNCTYGYVKNNSLCYQLMSEVSFKLESTITKAVETPFNRTAFIFALAKASQCGTCTQWENDPAVCGFCRIFIDNITKVTTPTRRLLSTSYVVGYRLVMIVPTTEVAKTTSPAQVTNLTNTISSNLAQELGSSTPVTTSTTNVTVKDTVSVNPPPPPLVTTSTSTSIVLVQTTTTQSIPTTTQAPLVGTTSTPVSTTQGAVAPQPTAAPAETPSSNMALIGGAAGGGVFLLVLISLVGVLLERQSHKQPKVEPPAKPTAQAADSGLMYHRGDGLLELRVRVVPPVYRIY